MFKKVEELREEDQMRLTEMQALHQSITELNIEQLPGGSSSEELHRYVHVSPHEWYV